MVILLIVAFGNTAAQEVSVQIQSNQSRYLIGEYAPVHIRVNADRMLQIMWPELTDTMARGLRILKSEPVDTVTDPDGIAHYQLTFIVSAYDTGKYVIHPITIRYQPHGISEIREASTSYLTLFFDSVTVDEEAALRGIKDPMAIGFSIIEILLLVLVLILILIAARLVIRYYRGKGKTKTVQPEKSMVTVGLEPWELALEALQALRQSSLLRDGQNKEFWVGLSGLLREYIHSGLGINAPELTTRQTLRGLSSHPMVNASLLAHITGLLQLADMVKFARALPAPEESIAMTDHAAAFIAGTAPAHVKPNEEKEEQK
ncbi:MAG: hypothetical protein R6V49_08370 [Bacteroidales bacterium]